jgi:large subunit ribosomal protein L35Ae
MARGVIVSYRRGLRVHRCDECLLKLPGCDSSGKAAAFIGKKVVWRSRSGKTWAGRIIATHGKRGVLIARFKKGLPGEALGGEVLVT